MLATRARVVSKALSAARILTLGSLSKKIVTTGTTMTSLRCSTLSVLAGFQSPQIWRKPESGLKREGIDNRDGIIAPPPRRQVLLIILYAITRGVAGLFVVVIIAGAGTLVYLVPPRNAHTQSIVWYPECYRTAAGSGDVGGSGRGLERDTQKRDGDGGKGLGPRVRKYAITDPRGTVHSE
ncbi:hypothetical protein BJY52DRAFT_1227770 [Lactarius psammicola]|nr:hypothetical protein BJY52DRAFT_1227770 [Lactarius psammicola]